jgi:hypothetical protein
MGYSDVLFTLALTIGLMQVGCRAGPVQMKAPRNFKLM